MAENHVLLEFIELTQSAASITFDNIPQTGYTDLKILVSGRATTSGYDATPWVTGTITLNSTAVTSGKLLFGTGSSAGSDGNANPAFITDTNGTANTFGSFEMYLPNYTSSANKTISVDVVTENNATSSVIGMQAVLSTVNVPVTSIKLEPHPTAAYAVGCTFSLYGIAEFGTTPVTAPFATGGNIVANDGTYWYHAFLSSGTFTPLKALSCDYLVIAGGGGGGGHNAGGGGAGGFRSTVTQTGGNSAGVNLETALSLISGTAYTVSIGAGGAGGNNARGVSGNSSVFSTITSVGGAGGGGANSGEPPVTGGSGGGGSQGGSNSQGTSNQGFEGGGSPTVNNSGGGGGGAGAAGSPSSGTNGGNGGAGIQISSFATPTNTGVSGFYAGGGGGSSFNGSQGAAGSGGATAGQYAAAADATANTGSGAGGRNREPGAAGNGGSGLVIIRYPMV
jgi:hypothetical protein